MKTKLFPLLIILLLITGCGTKLLVFTGESDNWSAKITTTQTDDLQEDEIFLEYTGDDTDSINEFNYYVESNVDGYSREGASLNKSNALRDKGNMSRGGAMATESTIIKVRIEWDGKSETITLKHK